MPIQFRCDNCRTLLSISTRQAGAEIVCPACTESTHVPSVDAVRAAEAKRTARSDPSAGGSKKRQPPTADDSRHGR